MEKRVVNCELYIQKNESSELKGSKTSSEKRKFKTLWYGYTFKQKSSDLKLNLGILGLNKEQETYEKKRMNQAALSS